MLREGETDGAEHLERLFKTRELAYSTSLLVVLWREPFFLSFGMIYTFLRFTFHSVDRLDDVDVPFVSLS